MKVDALKLVKMRNHFYRDGFRRLTLVLLLSVLLNVVLFLAFFYVSTRPTKAVYFASTTDGKLIYLQPRNIPVMSDQAILGWVSRSIPAIYNLDFLNYRSQLQGSRKYFTSYGWSEFVKAFASTVAKVRDNKMVSKATPYDTPTVVSEGVINGVYSWRVQVPLLVTYEKDGNEDVQKVLWTVLLQRLDDPNTTQLVGISQVIQTFENSN